MQQLEELKTILGTVADLNSAVAVLSWDQETYMPEGGAEARAAQLATLTRLSHETFTSARVGELLAFLEAQDLGDPDGFVASLVRVTRRDYDRATKLPAEFVQEQALAQNAAHHAWIRARAESNFELFRPHLERMFELARRQADLLGYEEHPYDALLDQYEPGARVAEVRRIFADLRDQTLPLVKAIAARGDATDYSVLTRYFNVDRQREFALKVAGALGLQPQFSRLDVSAHPFQTTFDHDDVRITTRFDPHFFPAALFGVWHETGHAMYEHGVDPELARTPLAAGASLGVHESQSRMLENLVCRSRAFWQGYFGEFQAMFPEALERVDLESFYRAINRVEPSLIRVEADEVTYNFHIMLRFELELALLEGSLEVKDLPAAWNAKMQDYLGITPASDAEGVLQDIHWSAGLIGYFPTYSLGNLLSVQLLEAARRALPDLDAHIAAGQFAPLMTWLRENVHRHGRKLLPRQITERATGEALTARYYVDYLWRKFGEIYGVSREPAVSAD
ncbi:carboxypeptidase Taq [Deinobacterium chartae]|uniref:Metal-dependent carboxypeptidase n=1 Tax=Deinobacterium chartae TaxID=521158 RepID=A0A841I4X3_9DEIO|nr:carboxypeptidase M32 [Deinobacterium chartae]MBB6100084.1 carboxypeptidase Taq [Deinobacterium chartae]